MADFPTLKTGAVAQYPAARTVRFRNQVLRFLDGSEQRYRDSAGPLRRWEIQLEQLDEGEMAALERFFEARQGEAGTFTFQDPWDGRSYPTCRLDGADLQSMATGEMERSTSLVIVEERS